MCLAPASDLHRTHHEDSSSTGCVIEHPVQTDARGIASSTNVPDREPKWQELVTDFAGDMVPLFGHHPSRESGPSSLSSRRRAQRLWRTPGSTGRKRFDEIASTPDGTHLQAKCA